MSLLPTNYPLPRLFEATGVAPWARDLVGALMRQLHDLAAAVNTTTPVLTLPEQTTTPGNPTDGAEARCYIASDKLVIQFNDGGTVRYKYLDLTGTGTTWTHTTVAP